MKFLKKIGTPTLVLLLFGIVIIITTQFDVFFRDFGINKEYQHQITIEVFGAGLIAFVASLAFFFYQDSITESSKSEKAQNFYKDTLLLDIKEAFERDLLYWNFVGNHVWVYDKSYINSLFDVYNRNKEYLWEYRKYLNQPVIKVFESLYLKTREAYVQSEKLETLLNRKVRHIRHDLDSEVPSQWTNYYICYVRAKLFIPDEISEAVPFISQFCDGSESVAVSFSESIYAKLEKDKEIISFIKIVKKERTKLLKLIEEVRSKI